MLDRSYSILTPFKYISVVQTHASIPGGCLAMLDLIRIGYKNRLARKDICVLRKHQRTEKKHVLVTKKMKTLEVKYIIVNKKWKKNKQGEAREPEAKVVSKNATVLYRSPKPLPGLYCESSYPTSKKFLYVYFSC